MTSRHLRPKGQQPRSPPIAMAQSLLRLLLLALALVSSSGLRVFVGSTRSSTVARAATRMALPKVEDARNLSTEEIEQEIVAAQKVCSGPCA